MCSPGLDHTPPIGEHLDAAYFEHGAILHLGGRASRTRGHHHAKPRNWGFQAPAKHEAISTEARISNTEWRRRQGLPRFEKVEEGGNAREAELADEDGGVEARIALLGFDRVAPFLVDCGKGFEDWAGVSGR